jgi:hypothetical protein
VRLAATSRKARVAATLAVLALLAAGCQDDESEPAGLPDPVAETRSQILAAAESRAYDQLPPLLRDGGEVTRWRQAGPKPLEIMDAVLRMPHQVRETNEGTLYQWPRFGPNSEPGEMSESERALLQRVMTEGEVRGLIHPDYGYTAPRLGILADGRWWFFVLDRAP